MNGKNRYDEHVCECGVGHPGIKRTLALAKLQFIKNDVVIDKSYCDELLKVCSIHGCDGCCSKEDFPGKFTKIEFDDASLELMKYLKNKDSFKTQRIKNE